MFSERMEISVRLLEFIFQQNMDLLSNLFASLNLFNSSKYTKFGCDECLWPHSHIFVIHAFALNIFLIHKSIIWLDLNPLSVYADFEPL